MPRKSAVLDRLQKVLGSDALRTANDEHASLSGFMLARCGPMPLPGQALELDGSRLEVAVVDDRRIASILVGRLDGPAAGPS